MTHEIITSLLNEEKIRLTSSPYCTSVVLTKRKNGSCRLCIDYRALNEITVNYHYHLPRIKDQIDRLRGKSWFTSVDLEDVSPQVQMAEDSVKYTLFATPKGQFEYLKIPFGLVNASANFQRFIN